MTGQETEVYEQSMRNRILHWHFRIKDACDRGDVQCYCDALSPISVPTLVISICPPGSDRVEISYRSGMHNPAHELSSKIITSRLEASRRVKCPGKPSWLVSPIHEHAF